MRDKLIELIRRHCLLQLKLTECTATAETSCAECLADHLLANGVIVPPCKVGDTVYINGIMGYGEAEPHKVVHAQCRIGSAGQSWYFDALLVGGRGDCGFWDDQIGKSVFRSREEAEQALREVQGDA